MTPQDLAKLLEYIRENNAWGDKMYDVNVIRKRRAVKYVDACFDSRDGRVWQITLRSCVPGGDVNFNVSAEQGVKALYAWLDETIK